MANTAGLENAAARRVRLLELIRTNIETRGYPPTAGELADATGVHRSMVQLDLTALERAHLIEVDRGTTRGMRLVGYTVRLIPAADEVDQ